MYWFTLLDSFSRFLDVDTRFCTAYEQPLPKWWQDEEIGNVVEDVVDGVVGIVEDVIGWIIPMPEIPDFSQQNSEQQARGVLVNKFTANGHIPIVYGTRKVGGHVVFLETSGTDNQYLYMALVLSEGEINDITSLLLSYIGAPLNPPFSTGKVLQAWICLNLSTLIKYSSSLKVVSGEILPINHSLEFEEKSSMPSV